MKLACFSKWTINSSLVFRKLAIFLIFYQKKKIKNSIIFYLLQSKIDIIWNHWPDVDAWDQLEYIRMHLLLLAYYNCFSIIVVHVYSIVHSLLCAAILELLLNLLQKLFRVLMFCQHVLYRKIFLPFLFVIGSSRNIILCVRVIILSCVVRSISFMEDRMLIVFSGFFNLSSF